MGAEKADHRDANRILSAVLDDPTTVSESDLDRALGLFDSETERVRIGAAWAFGVVAAESPGRVLPYVPEISTYLDDPAARSAASRALSYIAQSNSEQIELELKKVDESLARRCRTALWGQFPPKTVVETTDDAPDGGGSMGPTDGDGWGWLGGGTGSTYDITTESRRRRPPTERPVDAPAVDYEYDQYMPTEAIYRGERVQTFKVIYRTDANDINPGLFKRFETTGEGFEADFVRRIGMWQSIDDHDAILPVVDWGIDPDPWIVTAYEDSTGLKAPARRGQLDAAIWMLREIADAFQFAHDRGVIHGGLTPGSIVRTSILSEPDAWRYPRVSDWGYVSLLRDGAPPESLSEAYLAPEHLDPDSFGSVDGTTDVYGFGVLAHEALLGRPPFESAESSPDGPGRLSSAEFDRSLPELDSFLRRCLAKRKPERFETVSAMATAFRSVMEGLDG